MSRVLNSVQIGIYNQLSGFAALTALIGVDKIFDFVPEDEDAPYVVIGEDTAIDFDTKTDNGFEITITIHSWNYENSGRRSVKQIMGCIYDALHKNEGSVIVQGYELILLYCEFQETFQETAIEGASDRYYHGVQRFRALVTEV